MARHPLVFHQERECISIEDDVRKPVPRFVMCRATINFANGAIEVEATAIAEVFDLPPEVLMTMHEGRYRITFFHGSKRLRLVVDDQTIKH